MLKTYEAISVHDNDLVNESAEARQTGTAYLNRFIPGDIVRRPMFEEDLTYDIVVPVGLVVWVSKPYKASSLSDCCNIMVLWS